MCVKKINVFIGFSEIFLAWMIVPSSSYKKAEIRSNALPIFYYRVHLEFHINFETLLEAMERAFLCKIKLSACICLYSSQCFSRLAFHSSLFTTQYIFLFGCTTFPLLTAHACSLVYHCKSCARSQCLKAPILHGRVSDFTNFITRKCATMLPKPCCLHHILVVGCKKCIPYTFYFINYSLLLPINLLDQELIFALRCSQGTRVLKT